jgi:L-amino acid N-acyltransferase YncA
MCPASSASTVGIVVRDSTDDDMSAARSIYARYVASALATFEEAPPSVEDMLERRRKVLDLGLPYLVAHAGDEALGFCYAGAYHIRSAYRHTIEDSIYVADGQRGRGIGAALLGALIARCENGPWRQMVAIIGDSGNAGSIALHRRMGFEPVGTLRSVGFKFGQWVDVAIMQRALGLGDRDVPGQVE